LLQVCSGNNAFIQVNGSQNDITYQLRDNSDNSIIGSPISGSGSSLAVSTGALTKTTTFNILGYNEGCSLLMSGTPQIIVIPIPLAPDIIGQTSLCTGQTTIFSTTAIGTITWASTNQSIATIQSNGKLTAVSEGLTGVTYTVSKDSCSATSTELSISIMILPVTSPIIHIKTN